jgi:hypothetical protein
MNKHDYNLKSFYDEDAISYYLLGAFMTDGCVHKSKNRPNRKSITLTSKDMDWLEAINQHISPNKPLLKHGERCFRLMYNSTKLADWLISKGCDERKSLTLQFPNVPPKYLPDFIRGCWDGDGSISFTMSGNGGTTYQRQANLTSGSIAFCQAMTDALNNNGVRCNVKPHKVPERQIDGRTLKASVSWRVVLTSGKSTYDLVKLIYYPTCPLAMPRKMNIAQRIIDDWEQGNKCIVCNAILPTRNAKKQYCQECFRLHMNERNRKAYALKKLVPQQ